MNVKTKMLAPLLTVVVGCSMVSPQEGEDVELRALTPQETAVVTSYNDFGLDLFRALDGAGDADESPNLFVSPLSVSMALGMTLNGAAGETRTAMEQTLTVQGLSTNAINDAYRGLLDVLGDLDARVSLSLANAIWYREGFDVEPPFLEVSRTAFDAAVRALDFEDPASVNLINGWVEDATEGRIQDLIDSIEPQHVMFLVNAIYFKGVWTYAFDADETRDEPFTRGDGTQATIPMMHQEADLPYAANDVFEVVDLPYGDSLFSMTVLLPRPGRDVDEVVAGLDAGAWQAALGRLSVRGVDLKLPRFALEYEKELNEVLSELGMGVAFDPARADFTGIRSSGGLYVDYVKHKSFVEVNEEGTEAAAATVVAIGETSVGGGGPVPVHVDRPFVFAIRERHTGTILFIGKVSHL